MTGVSIAFGGVAGMAKTSAAIEAQSIVVVLKCMTWKLSFSCIMVVIGMID